MVRKQPYNICKHITIAVLQYNYKNRLQANLDVYHKFDLNTFFSNTNFCSLKCLPVEGQFLTSEMIQLHKRKKKKCKYHFTLLQN